MSEANNFPQVGDAVFYGVQNRMVFALVLAVRDSEVSHNGKNGEPVLTVAFVDPTRESEIAKNKIGYLPQVFIEYDVVHSSHEFSREFRLAKGIQTPAQVASHRGQGEWTEIRFDLSKGQ